jgi:hypothetical protein
VKSTRKKAIWTQAFPEQVKRAHAVEVRKERRLYLKRKTIFLQEHPLCEWWLKHGVKVKATELHHERGRRGPLLLNEKFWHSASASGHAKIHKHIMLARSLGLLAPQGKWGVNE